MENYTGNGSIVRGSRWPPADDSLTVTLTKSSGWPDGADSWTWSLLLSRTWAGGDADLTLTADSVTIDGDELTATFHATPAETAALPGAGRTTYRVDLKSDDGAGDVSYYDVVQGEADVRDYSGGL